MIRLDATTVREAARGLWRTSVYPALGIEVGTGKHGPCPHCGGRDRFRCDDRDGSGSYYCNGCGAGDGFSMVMKIRRSTFPEALNLVTGVLGITASPAAGAKIRKIQSRPPRVNLNEVAFQFLLHAWCLAIRSEETLTAAQGLDCSQWTDEDFDHALKGVARAYDDRNHAEMLEGVAYRLRERVMLQGKPHAA